MEKEPRSEEARRHQAGATGDKIGEPIRLAERAMQASLNLQWERAQELNELAQEKAKTLDAPEGEVISAMTGALTTMNEGMVVQFRDTDPERFQRAMQHFQAARDRIQELKDRSPGKTADVNFEGLLTSLELQAIWASRRMAREQGDQAQVLRHDAQVKALIDRMPEESKNQLQGVIVLLRYQEMMGRIKEGMAALSAMDLELALRIIAQIREEGGSALSAFRQSLPGGVLVQSSEQMMIGAHQYVEGLEGYVGCFTTQLSAT
jgi:hypothetical protein